jgi:hypothetical protein
VYVRTHIHLRVRAHAYVQAALSVDVNITTLEHSLRKVVVYLDPSEYHSFWVGNKSVYRTRLAIADGGAAPYASCSWGCYANPYSQVSCWCSLQGLKCLARIQQSTR